MWTERAGRKSVLKEKAVFMELFQQHPPPFHDDPEVDKLLYDYIYDGPPEKSKIQAMVSWLKAAQEHQADLRFSHPVLTAAIVDWNLGLSKNEKRFPRNNSKRWAQERAHVMMVATDHLRELWKRGDPWLAEIGLCCPEDYCETESNSTKCSPTKIFPSWMVRDVRSMLCESDDWAENPDDEDEDEGDEIQETSACNLHVPIYTYSICLCISRSVVLRYIRLWRSTRRATRNKKVRTPT